MWNKLRPLLLLIAFLSVCASSDAQGGSSSVDSSSAFAITDVTVVDLFGGSAKTDQTVLVDKGRILRVGKSGGVALPRKTLRVDGRGKYLIPGLWDAHVHLESSGDSALVLLIANGVTGVRDMAGDFKTLKEWRSEIAACQRIGPRILMSGPALESAKFLEILPKVDQMLGLHLTAEILPTRIGVANPEEARSAVDHLAETGADFVKFRTVASREVFLAISDEARKRGIAFAGHEPDVVSLAEASSLGERSIEHLPFESLGKASVAARLATFKTFVRNATWIDPTLVTMIGYRGTPDARIKAIIEDKSNSIDRRRRYVSPKLLEFWRAQIVIKQVESPMDWAALIQQSFLDLRAMHQAGVHLLAGTDLGAPLVYPGFSLHDELALLVEKGGLSPVEALRTAIVEPAFLMGLQRDFGSVETGKTADLLLLDADPTKDIRNTQRIFAVVAGGRFFDRKALDAMLAEAEKSAGEGNARKERQ